MRLLPRLDEWSCSQQEGARCLPKNVHNLLHSCGIEGPQALVQTGLLSIRPEIPFDLLCHQRCLEPRCLHHDEPEPFQVGAAGSIKRQREQAWMRDPKLSEACCRSFKPYKHTWCTLCNSVQERGR